VKPENSGFLESNDPTKFNNLRCKLPFFEVTVKNVGLQSAEPLAFFFYFITFYTMFLIGKPKAVYFTASI